MIKIEPNFVLRGAIFACEEKELCEKAQDQFLKFMRIKTLSIGDLYGGKICAALDRYHPRDLFDMKLLLDSQGLTDPIRQAAAQGPCMSFLIPELVIYHDKNLKIHLKTNFPV